MSKTIEIARCEECPHLVFMGSCTRKNGFCALFARQAGETKDGDGEFNDNRPIPSWCPLPDSKPPYKYKTVDLAWENNERMPNDCDFKGFTAGFNSARERKEG